MVSRVGHALWLGRRFALRGRTVGPLALVVLVAALATVSLSAVLSAPLVVSEQRTARDRLDIADTGVTTGLWAVATNVSWKDRYTIRKVSLASDGSGPPPPGLDRFPGPGTVYVSPALRAAAATDPDLALVVQGEPDGLIRQAGLVSPHDMVLYQGVSPRDMTSRGLRPTARFGDVYDVVTIDPVLVRLSTATIILFLIVPLLTVLSAALAQLGTRRAARGLALHRIGMPARHARIALGLDGVGACSAGVLIGAVAFHVASRWVQTLPGVPASWWPSDVRTAPWQTAVAVTAPVLVAVLSTVLLPRDRDRAGPARATSAIRLLPLVAGLAFLSVTYGRRVDGSDTNLALVGIAIVLLVVGVPLVVPWLNQAAGTALIRARSVRWNLAGARLARGGTPARRASTTMAAAVLLATAAAPLVAQAAPRDTFTAEANSRSGRVVAQLSGFGDHQDLSSLRHLPGVLSVAAADSRSGTTVFRMSCASFALLQGVTGSCEPRRIAVENLTPAAHTSLDGFEGGWYVEIGQESPTINISPKVPGAPELQALVLVDDESTYWKLAGTVTSLPGPAAAFAGLGGLTGGPDQPYRKVQQWLRFGMTGLLCAASAVVLLGLVEDRRSRRDVVAGLLALGTPAHVVRSAHRREIGTRLGINAAITMASAAALALVSTSWVGADQWPFGWMLTIGAVVTGALILAFIVGPVSARSRHLADLPRGE